MPDKDTIRLISQSRGVSKRDLLGKVNYIEVWTNNGEDTVAEVYESTGNITQIIHFMDIDGGFSCIGYINYNNSTYDLELERFGADEDGKGRYAGWNISASEKIKDILKDSWDNQYFKPYILKEEASNPNLFINADFKVNQRGQTTYNSPNYYYTVDHWSIWDNSTTSAHCSLEVYDDHIKYMGSTGTAPAGTDLENCLYQPFELVDIKKIVGKKVTISCYIQSLQGEAHFKSNFGISHWVRSENLQEGFNSYTFEVADIGPSQDGRGLIGIQLIGNAIVEVCWMKLEVGEFATKFISVTYGEDLAKCQRYYIKLWYGANEWIPIHGYFHDINWDANNTIICATISLPQELRVTNPSINFGNFCYTWVYYGPNRVAPNKTPTIQNVRGNQIAIHIETNTGSGMEWGESCAVIFQNWVSFEAEL